MMNMEKKEYIAPECEIVEMEGAVYMLDASFTEEPGGEVEEGGGNDMGANRHRGEWGNLWGTRK